MTLQQLRYAVAAAEKGSINEAAKGLFISQPSLSNAIKELEEKIETPIFIRTNRGLVVTPAGSDFLGYARQVLQQADLLEEKYIKGRSYVKRFSVSTQHYAFTSNAFVELIKNFGGEEYEFSLRESTTYDIINDVRTMRSEIGVLYLSDFNERIIGKLLKDNGLVFEELFAVPPHIFICKAHPLAKKEIIKLEELEDYPCITFDQGEQNSFYFSEEILSTISRKQSIKVTDRGALINLMIGLNAYAITTGVLPDTLHGEEVLTIPLDIDEIIRVGVITNKDTILSQLGKIYLDALHKIGDEIKFKL